jgi:hypothetical protein
MGSSVLVTSPSTEAEGWFGCRVAGWVLGGVIIAVIVI